MAKSNSYLNPIAFNQVLKRMNRSTQGLSKKRLRKKAIKAIQHTQIDTNEI